MLLWVIKLKFISFVCCVRYRYAFIIDWIVRDSILAVHNKCLKFTEKGTNPNCIRLQNHINTYSQSLWMMFVAFFVSFSTVFHRFFGTWNFCTWQTMIDKFIFIVKLVRVYVFSFSVKDWIISLLQSQSYTHTQAEWKKSNKNVGWVT